VLWKSMQGRSYFWNGCKWNWVCLHSMKQYDILKAKNTFVKSVCDVREYTICSFVIQGEQKWLLLMTIFYWEAVKGDTASRYSAILRDLFKSLTVLYNVWVSGCCVLLISFTIISVDGK
jgi:hypothetical protein